VLKVVEKSKKLKTHKTKQQLSRCRLPKGPIGTRRSTLQVMSLQRYV